MVEGVLFFVDYSAESPREARTSSGKLYLYTHATYLAVSSVVTLSDLTLSNYKLLIKCPYTTDIPVSFPDEIVNLYMYHFCLSIENSNYKSVQS